MPKNKKEVKLVGFSIVIVGTGFSPSNFDGDMLADKEIIPSDWNWKVFNNLSSSILSQIVYELGKVSIRVEKNKITIADNYIENNKIENSKISEIAKRLIQRHKHLTFTALGINFESIVPLEDFKGYLTTNFIKDAKIKNGEIVVENVSITLRYALKNGGLLNAVLEEGALGRQTDNETIEFNGIVCSANFHRDFTVNADTALIISQLNHIKEDKQFLIKILQSIIE